MLENANGGTLYDLLLTKIKLEPIHTKHLITQILKGTQQFHNLGLVHRDIKPSNIMLKFGV